jgi:signal transduction histidine kinase
MGWNTGIWLLAAGLGATAVASTVGIVHENAQRHTSARMLGHAVVLQIEAVARERLEILAYEKLAPVATGLPSGVDGGLSALVSAELESRACGCRDSVDAVEFFKYSATGDQLDVRSYKSNDGKALDDETLGAVGRAELARQALGGRSPIHLIANRALGNYGVVTLARRDARTGRADVYGFVADVHALASMLLQPAAPGQTSLARIDSSSLGMETRDSMLLAGHVRGAVGNPPPIAGIDPLEGITINVALDPSQLPRSLLGPPPQELWHLAFLLLATTIVIGVAARWSRRELVVARARSDFIAGVSHDLRMPLAQILLASETLVSRPIRTDGERDKLTNSILREARRLVAMVENILLFSQSGSVGDKARTDAVSVSDLFEDVTEAVQLAADDAGQRIEAILDEDIHVLGGKRALCQALVNLVDNSLKYGKPRQTVTLRASRKSPGIVWLTVEDEGEGVPVDERTRVFDPYHRLARDARSERTGTGLGLAVVQRIVAACGGRTWLDDAAGGGARAVIEVRESIARADVESGVKRT